MRKGRGDGEEGDRGHGGHRCSGGRPGPGDSAGSGRSVRGTCGDAESGLREGAGARGRRGGGRTGGPG